MTPILTSPLKALGGSSATLFLIAALLVGGARTERGSRHLGLSNAFSKQATINFRTKPRLVGQEAEVLGPRANWE